MRIKTKADLLKELEDFEDNAEIWIDDCMNSSNYLFSITNPTEIDGSKSWDILIEDIEEEEGED